MAFAESIRDTTVPADPCIHCANGWVYEPDEETGEDAAIGCWMCPKGRTIEAGRS
jgi:hypothetical protein